jgi:hypothetical protein
LLTTHIKVEWKIGREIAASSRHNLQIISRRVSNKWRQIETGRMDQRRANQEKE